MSSKSYPTQASYQTTYAYDSAGELVSATTPATTAATSGATTTATYDPAGNTLTRTDPNGITTTWTYTPLSNPATITYSGSSAHKVTWAYDADGSKTAMTDATGTSTYTYDPFGELTSTTNGAGQTTGYTYDADGNTTSLTYPLPSTATWAASDTVTSAYDHAGQLTSVTDFNGNKIAITNTADGQPSSVALGSTGDTITTSYDNTDTPSAIALNNGTSTLQSFTYTDAPAGNILNETDTPSSSHSPAVYTYDAKSRVTSMTPGTGSTLNYSFDASSNLTTLPTGATGTYDKAGELTSSTQSGTTTSYTYNAGGQQLSASQGSTTISQATWNGAAQLTTYNDNAANMTAATYDGNGLRASTTTTPAGGSATTQGYVWGDGDLLMDASNAYIYAGGTAPTEQVNLATGAVTYLTADSLGSVRSVINSSGALTATTSCDAWGNPQTTAGLTATTPFGYAGGYTDPTGLIYLINRYYDPVTGQFLSVDPEVQSTNQAYGYASGDPVKVTDPTGLAAAGWSGSDTGPTLSAQRERNNRGCGGFYRGKDKFGCRATAVDIFGSRVVIRHGILFHRVNKKGEEVLTGFGLMKAEGKHNLDLQPILDAITMSRDIHRRDDGRRDYFHVFYRDREGSVSEIVQIVIDTTVFYDKTTRTPDGRDLGLLTAFCQSGKVPGHPIQPLCPQWVNETL